MTKDKGKTGLIDVKEFPQRDEDFLRGRCRRWRRRRWRRR
jgi:hypothetical protein